MSALSGTPRKPKRRRRTNAELEAVDVALYDIVNEHRPCTIRQVYYIATTQYICDKTDSGYNLVQRQLLKLRRAGALPYAWIVDNLRMRYGRTRWSTPEDFARASRYLYHYDYWHDSPVTVQIWVESDSIAGTLRSLVADEYGLDLYIARGFSSETYLFEAGRDIGEDGRPAHVYILSDFDPSGVTLAEDIGRKLPAFAGVVPVTVERIALSRAQVAAWRLPTHDLKKGDKRAAAFRRHHGDEACELEAIPPKMLRELVASTIAAHVPAGRIEAAKRDEAMQRDALEQVAEHLPTFLGGTA